MKSNITPSIQAKIGKNLHNKKNHPLEIIKRKIYEYFGNDYTKFDDINPIVKIEDNFDKLLIPKEHPARSMSDTYYLEDNNFCLRTHTSSSQSNLLSEGHTKFLVTGDVYRKDDIDASHYPVFHQMEGVCVMKEGQDAENELKDVLTGLVNTLFPGCEYRFNNDYFPFTNPSFEVEVMFNGRWMEVLGCGVVQPKIMENCGLGNKTAWAFGLGLERLAMVLFKINDIRYFWSEDDRFHSQFQTGQIIEFKEYSNYPATSRDIAFWVSEKVSQDLSETKTEDEKKRVFQIVQNEISEIAREKGGDLIENLTMVESFVHPKNGRTSLCYRIVYRSNDRTLTSDEINEIQNGVRTEVSEKLMFEIR